MNEMNKHKEYRIDIIGGGIKNCVYYFDDEIRAIVFAVENTPVGIGAHSFLLRHVIDGLYDVVAQIK